MPLFFISLSFTLFFLFVSLLFQLLVCTFRCVSVSRLSAFGLLCLSSYLFFTVLFFFFLHDSHILFISFTVFSLKKMKYKLRKYAVKLCCLPPHYTNYEILFWDCSHPSSFTISPQLFLRSIISSWSPEHRKQDGDGELERTPQRRHPFPSWGKLKETLLWSTYSPNLGKMLREIFFWCRYTTHIYTSIRVFYSFTFFQNILCNLRETD